MQSSRIHAAARAALIVACAAACLSAEHPSREGQGLPSDGPPPRTCPLAPDHEPGGELCRFDVTCSGGRLYGAYGNGCYRINECCELGCRQDLGPEPRLAGGGNENRPSELAHTLCEEYRLLHGARRPGDPCGDEFDCLPYAESATGQGEAWPELMACVDGTCREQAPITPADYEAPCMADVVEWTAGMISGVVMRGSCDNGQCSIADSSGVGHCTMQCQADADCPAGSSCRTQAIGRIVNFYDHGSGSFCAPTCRDTGTCDVMSE